MMIHEKLISGQFLLDLKNERASLLNGHHQQNLNELHPQHTALTTHYLNLNHHQHHQLAHPTIQHQPPSPPVDIYAAYAYQQHQQQLMNNYKHNDICIKNNNNNNNNSNSNETDSKVEVLDLSRRCDSVETPRKTPSPAQTNSSIGTASPAISPKNQQPTTLTQQPVIPTNLLYSMHAQQQPIQMPPPLPAALATLYPALYYPAGMIKPEPKSPISSPSTTPPPPLLPPSNLQTTAVTTPTSSHIKLPISTATDLLQTFATAAAAKSPKLTSPPTNECKSPSTENITRSSSHLNMLAALDEKGTRPFKALPRDPLVIAANFAATDVLLDDERVERYTEYRKRVLEHIRNSNGGTRSVTNPKMRRINSRSVDSSNCHSSSEECQERNSSKTSVNGADESSDCDSNAGSFSDKNMTSSSAQNTSTTTTATTGGIVKDAAYLERRRKNNAAAKKSRDRRRFKEDELAIRAEYLARENYQLACEIKSLKAQLAAYTSKVGA